MVRANRARAEEVRAVAEFRAADPEHAEMLNVELEAVLEGKTTAAQIMEREQNKQDALRRELAEVQQACRELAAVFVQAQRQAIGTRAQNMALIQHIGQGPDGGEEGGARAAEAALRAEADAAPLLQPLEALLAQEAPELFQALRNDNLLAALGMAAPEPAQGPAEAPELPALGEPNDPPAQRGPEEPGPEAPPKPARKGRGRRPRRTQHAAP